VTRAVGLLAAVDCEVDDRGQMVTCADTYRAGGGDTDIAVGQDVVEL
jgi:hypothetical protein